MSNREIQTIAIDDKMHALSGHFIDSVSAWLIFPNTTKHSSSYLNSINQSRPSRLPRLMHAPMTAYVSSQDRTIPFQRRSTYCDISSLGYSWLSISSASASEGVHSKLITANLTRTASYQAKLHATHWYYISWNKQIASKFTELRLIGLMKFSRFRGSLTKQQIFYI